MSFKTGSRADAALEVPQYLVPAPETIRMNLALGLVVRWWRTFGGSPDRWRWQKGGKMTEKRGSVCPAGFISGRRVDPGRGLLARRPVQPFPLPPWGNLEVLRLQIHASRGPTL